MGGKNAVKRVLNVLVKVAAVTGVTLLIGSSISKAYLDKVEPLDNEIKEGVANIVFIMDDGWSTQYTEGYRILSEHGLKGNIAVVTDSVGWKNYLNEKQLGEMYDRGFDVINHTQTHARLSDLPKDDQRKEIIRASVWLKKKGFERGAETFIYPYGAYNDDTIDILNEEGFRWARTALDGENPNKVVGLETYGYELLFGLDPQLVKKRIDSVIEGKNTLVIYNHKFGPTDDGSGMTYDIKAFEEVVGYIADKKEAGKLNVLTVSEYLDVKEVETVDSRDLFSSTEPIKYEDYLKLSEYTERNVDLVDGRWLPVFEEDFSALDDERWNITDDGTVWNNELQAYKPDNVQVRNNTLHLTGKRERYKGRDFTSGKISTEGKFNIKYGRIEFDLKTDFKLGSFPAVWLYPANSKTSLPEVDIFESIGKDKGAVYYVNHWEGGKSAYRHVLQKPMEYHNYAIEWRKDEIKWFVDDRLIYTSTEGIPDKPAFLIINLAIGGNWGGPPSKHTQFPITLEVKNLKIMREVVK